MNSVFQKPWYVYILLCNNGSLYTGITYNLKQRFKKHQQGKGAKYTRAHGAQQVIYFKEYPNHHDAAVREFEIKKLTQKQKVELIANHLIELTNISKSFY